MLKGIHHSNRKDRRDRRVHLTAVYVHVVRGTMPSLTPYLGRRLLSFRNLQGSCTRLPWTPSMFFLAITRLISAKGVLLWWVAHASIEDSLSDGMQKKLSSNTCGELVSARFRLSHIYGIYRKIGRFMLEKVAVLFALPCFLWVKLPVC